MISEAKIIPTLRDHEIDVLVTSTPMHVFYTSGLVTSTTVTPHQENFEETGFYFDTPPSPPKNFSIWSVDHGGPYLVIAPNESGQLPNLHFEDVYTYAPEGSSFGSSPTESDTTDVIQRALANQHPSVYRALAAMLEPMVDGSTTVALEQISLSPTGLDHITSSIDHDEIVEAMVPLHEMRLTKTPEEIARLRRAAEVNERAIEATIDELEEGMTEMEFANRFRMNQTRFGATHRHTHIGFGPNSANGHAVPGERVIQEGDLIRFEVGCYFVDDSTLERQIDPRHTYYPGDLARTYAFKSASDRHIQQYEVISRAMDKCHSLLEPGASVVAVHEETMAFARELAAERGVTELVDWRRRMMGHNIGLDCHDHPLIGPAMADYDHNILEPGMVINWELAHLEQGTGGIQLEETGIVTESGFEAVTSSEDELPIVG